VVRRASRLRAIQATCAGQATAAANSARSCRPSRGQAGCSAGGTIATRGNDRDRACSPRPGRSCDSCADPSRVAIGARVTEVAAEAGRELIRSTQSRPAVSAAGVHRTEGFRGCGAVEGYAPTASSCRRPSRHTSTDGSPTGHAPATRCGRSSNGRGNDTSLPGSTCRPSRLPRLRSCKTTRNSGNSCAAVCTRRPCRCTSRCRRSPAGVRTVGHPPDRTHHRPD
jgi:hypothetical protein